MTVSPLVDVAWLKAHLHDGDVAIVDTRWYLMDPSQGAAEYAVSHISGAVHLAIDEDLSSYPRVAPRRGLASLASRQWRRAEWPRIAPGSPIQWPTTAPLDD